MSSPAPNLQALEQWAASLLQRITPAQRQRLLRDVAQHLRRTNEGTMRKQQSPDGQEWEKRLPQKKGSLREKARTPLFDKLRRPRWLKAKAQGNAAVVEFAGKAQRIAAVHHFGRRDRVSAGRMHTYSARPLLGITDAERKKIQDMIVHHLHSGGST